MSEVIQSSVGNLSEYKPPKMWKDLTTEEKAERLREQIKQFSYSVGNANQNTNQLRNDFQNHDHKDGKVVKDVKTYNEGFGSAIGKISDPKAEAEGNVYF